MKVLHTIIMASNTVRVTRSRNVANIVLLSTLAETAAGKGKRSKEVPIEADVAKSLKVIENVSSKITKQSNVKSVNALPKSKGKQAISNVSQALAKIAPILENIIEMPPEDIKPATVSKPDVKSKHGRSKEASASTGIVEEEISLKSNTIRSKDITDIDECDENIAKDETSPISKPIPLKPKAKSKRQHIKVEFEETPCKLTKSEDIEDVKVNYPLNWDAVLRHLREMRKERTAPVDSMGCDQCMDDDANEKDKRYQALLSLMLSSQTKDEVTHAAMQRLIHHGCTLKNILETSDEILGKLIYPVGFWKTKVKYIKKSSEMLRDNYDGDIPNSVMELCKLSGVGPKMAHLCMKTAWGEVTGIGVDTHVHRISNRLGWCVTKTPEGTRRVLEDWLPRELWAEVNHLLVGFGQQVCTPINPQCATCLNYAICPFGVKQLKLNKKGVKDEQATVEKKKTK